jgi:cytochrome P450
MEAGAELLSMLRDPQVRRDPHPAFARLRARGPVLPVADGLWAVTTADAVHEVLDAPRRFSSALSNARALPAPPQEEGQADLLSRYYRHMMIFTDPPAHNRLRLLVQKAFTPARVRELAPAVEAIVDELLDGTPSDGELEVIEDLALPLPVRVICELMGIPESDRPRIHDWADVISAQLDNVVSMDAEQRQRADEALREYRDYLLSLFAARAADPRDDLVSALVAAEHDGSKLSEDELVATCVLLLGAGHETTVGLIGNGTLAFLRNPGEWSRLRDQPELVEGAVEEVFRYDGPVRMTYRVALERTDVDGVTVDAGDVMVVLLASANRDPARFPDPDRFDVGRPAERNFGSGFGIHFCLGSSLSRVESRIAFQRMAARWGELHPRLDLDRVEMRDAMMICRPEQVPVAVARGN